MKKVDAHTIIMILPQNWILLLSHRLSLTEAERFALEKFGLNVHALPVDDAEMGMDADKPFQLELCRRELAR